MQKNQQIIYEDVENHYEFTEDVGTSNPLSGHAPVVIVT